jgi:iron(II)-dependent oxidoreductase
VLAYHVLLGVFHEDMHGEALIYALQTLKRPGPAPWTAQQRDGPVLSTGQGTAADPRGDVRFAACDLRVGSDLGDGFAWDNEMPPATRHVGAFALARCAVTEGEFAQFVEAGGYETPELWDLPAGTDCPVMWRFTDGGWEVREFASWRPLDPLRPVIHVSAHEANAYCRMAGRRLPTEWEWEVAATTGEGERRRYPWGNAFPDARRANLDGRAMRTVPVTECAAGDSAGGCRQLIGNVWEWTASPFGPLPGFVAGPYAEYSEPWFDGAHTVLRGGCFATRARLIRGAYRNFFSPDRNDVFAGFRTAARES